MFGNLTNDYYRPTDRREVMTIIDPLTVVNSTSCYSVDSCSFIDTPGVFDNIVEFDVTGIDETATTGEVKETSRYSVNGQLLCMPIKGLNLVKYSDGVVKKVVVR